MTRIRGSVVIHNAAWVLAHIAEGLLFSKFNARPVHLRSLILLACLSGMAFEVNAETNLLEVRLLTKVSSRKSRPGDVVRAVVIAPLIKNGDIVVPAHTLVTGNVIRVGGIGLGLKRERAFLDLQFTKMEFPDGSTHPVQMTVATVHNARETVTEEGRIRGILATGGAPSFLMGMWSLPGPGMLARSSVGFSGISYFASQSFGFHPVPSAGIVALRIILVPFPEPEIRLNNTAELALQTEEIPNTHRRSVISAEVPKSIELLTAGQPWLTSFAVTGRSADITNFLFIGSRDELEQSFQAAGWDPTDPLTSKSALRVYRAMARQDAYTTAPVSTILLEGNPPDFVFQKSLNTIAKRHHIRIWKRPEHFEGREVWLGAATHDIGIRMGKGFTSFTHKIDPAIDTERQKIVNDLSFAGCVDSAHLVERSLDSIPEEFTTDGRIAAVSLHHCEEEPDFHGPMKPESPRIHRFTRRLILESRHSIVRGNVYYWGYRAIRHGFFSSKRPNVTTQ